MKVKTPPSHLATGREIIEDDGDDLSKDVQATCIVGIAIEVNGLGHNHSGARGGRNKLDRRRTDLNTRDHETTVKARHIDMRDRPKGRIRHRRLVVNA